MKKTVLFAELAERAVNMSFPPMSGEIAKQGQQVSEHHLMMPRQRCQTILFLFIVLVQETNPIQMYLLVLVNGSVNLLG